MREYKYFQDRLGRREFIRIGAAATMFGAISCGSRGEIPKRRLGKTDLKTSVVGMGGGSTLMMIKKYEDRLALIELAYNKGINFFDSAAEYGDGLSEKAFGEALEPHRKKVCLATKYEVGDSYESLMSKLDVSLGRLRTDYLDIATMHALEGTGSVDKMFASGALDTLVKLKEQGVVRYLGVSAHSQPLGLADALRRFSFDVVLMGANASKASFWNEFEPRTDDTSFEDTCLPLANEQEIGVYAFKVTGQRRLIGKPGEANKATPEELIRYSLSLPVHGIILGMNKIVHIENMVRMLREFEPMNSEEKLELNRRFPANAQQLGLDYLKPGYIDDGGPRAHLA